MNKRLAARLPGSGGLMSDEGLPLDVEVTRKPSPLTNGSGGPSLPQLIARGTDTVPYELLRKPMKMDGGSPSAPGSPPDGWVALLFSSGEQLVIALSRVGYIVRFSLDPYII